MKKDIFRKYFEVNWEKTNICIVTFQSNLYDSPLSLLVLTSLSDQVSLMRNSNEILAKSKIFGTRKNLYP